MACFTAEEKAKIIAQTIKLREAVHELFVLYDSNPDLNDVQPDSAQACYAMSLDEWVDGLDTAIADWQQTPLDSTPCDPSRGKW